jgi:MoxR-like ATPase
MEGTYPLPAQLDRFMFKVNVEYPSVEELVHIIDRTTGADVPEACRRRQTGDRYGQALNTPIASHVSEYVAQLVVATIRYPERAGDCQAFSAGASPRGAQALVIGAKSTLLDGEQFNVSFKDIAAVAPAALRHRLLLNFEGLAEGINPDLIIKDVIRSLA